MASGESQVWVITGCSSGLGKTLALEVLKQNDKVIATSRNSSGLGELQEAGAAALQFANEARRVYGKVDVLVNNAAYVAHGTIEESSPDETLQQYQTNVFAVLNMCRAFLPYFRSRRSGIIASIGSIGARLKSPNVGLYHGSKAALRSSHLALDLEVRPIGIKTYLIQPGGFRTQLLKPGANNLRAEGNEIAEYDALRKNTRERTSKFNGRQIGNPELGAKRIWEVLTSQGMAAGRDVPAELQLGSDAYHATRDILTEEIDAAEEWRDVSCSTDFAEGIPAWQGRVNV